MAFWQLPPRRRCRRHFPASRLRILRPQIHLRRRHLPELHLLHPCRRRAARGKGLACAGHLRPRCGGHYGVCPGDCGAGKLGRHLWPQGAHMGGGGLDDGVECRGVDGPDLWELCHYLFGMVSTFFPSFFPIPFSLKSLLNVRGICRRCASCFLGGDDFIR